MTVFTDNLKNQLHASDVTDFRTDFPDIQVTFQMTRRTAHDRFVVLDYGTADERIYHCGASSKDAGVKLMTEISEMADPDFINAFNTVVEEYLRNPALELR